MTCLDFWNQTIPRHDFLLIAEDPWMCDLPGCGYNSYAEKSLEGSDYAGRLSGCRKKLHKLGRLTPNAWMDRCALKPAALSPPPGQKCTIPPLSLLNWAKIGHQKAACLPRELGRGWGLLVSISCALICLTCIGPEKAPRYQHCQRWPNVFSRNNCFQHAEGLFLSAHHGGVNDHGQRVDTRQRL